MRRALLTATILALPFVAQAQPVTGLYVGAGAGGNFKQPEKIEIIDQSSGHAGSVARAKFHVSPGGAVVASVGYGFGNGLRIEAEGDYRYNKTRQAGSNAAAETFGGMANALFDFDIGSRYVWPYAGLGAGYMHAEHGYSNVTTNAFAYQAIAGVAFPIPFAVGLSATLEYRFQSLTSSSRKDSYPGPVLETQKYYNDLNHSLLLGLRYAFYVPRPPASSASASGTIPAAQVAPSRSYLVFFDWDRADLTMRARQIVAEAAANVGQVAHTRIEVTGHADRSGTPQYNQGLSQRRGQAVAAELARQGVAESQIVVTALGDTKPLVPTAAGVREPQNRRVEIVIR